MQIGPQKLLGGDFKVVFYYILRMFLQIIRVIFFKYKTINMVTLK